MASKPLTHKQRLFVETYLGLAAGNGTEAARLAGYRGSEATLAQVAHENLRKPEIAAELQRRVEKTAMPADEVLAELSRVARMDARIPGAAAPKVRALEILAKIHGLTSERLQISMDRGQLERSLDELIEQLMRQRLPAWKEAKLLTS
jgi:hypothetical protein